MTGESTEPIERWTAKRRVALVVSILKGEASVAAAARQHGLTVAEWRTGERSFWWERKMRYERDRRTKKPSKMSRSRSWNRRSGLSSSATTSYGRH
jgi:transposase-like protein